MITGVSDLIRAFEPILYFARGERFFPSDCKRYLERCALWNAASPFDSNSSWHKSGPSGTVPGPILSRGTISGRVGELGTTGTPKTFLGQKQDSAFPFLYASGPDEGFLDLAGWNDGKNVMPFTANRFANLDEIAVLYNSPPATDQFLKDSRFWYHAEVFDAQRMRLLVSGNRNVTQVPAFLLSSGEPLLLCYYLFFPGHDEPLENCGSDAAMFGSYAGEWACIAILLNVSIVEVSLHGEPVKEEIRPVAIGLTSRNVGDIGFLGGERRVGMQIHDWGAVQTITRERGLGKLQGIHPRLFVAKGTHGLYLSEGDKPVPYFAPEDSSRRHCGKAELLDKTLDDLDDEAEEAADDVWVDDSEVLWLKVFLLGLIWAGIEWAAGGAGGFTLPGTKTPEQFDRPPYRDASDYFSVIIHPMGVDPLAAPITPSSPGAPHPQKFAWQFPLADEAKLETQIGGRLYSMRVDRVSSDPATRQVWWPGIQGHIGYSGRWGPRVAIDPKARRAGMKFPEFWEMFMAAFPKAKAG
jgi:hypothetical protein